MDTSEYQQEQAIAQALEERYPALRFCREDIWSAFLLLANCYHQGGKLLICGNGGSGSDSLHIVGELMKEFMEKRELDAEFRHFLQESTQAEAGYLLKKLQGALPAVALVENAALSTAVENDIAGDISFAQQVYGLGQRGDILLCLTTSGNSRNVCLAAVTARARGMAVISMTGKAGGQIQPCSDVCIRVPETQTYLVQELHLPVYHALCAMLEKHFFANEVRQ